MKNIRLVVAVSLLLGAAFDADAGWKPPAGFNVPEMSISPDGRYGVLAPDLDHYQMEGPPQNQLVDLKSGVVLVPIKAANFGHGPEPGPDLHYGWSADGSVLCWYVDGHLQPKAYVMLKVEDGKVAWQLDVAKSAQQSLLPQARSAAPANYAAAVKYNERKVGSDYPDGFTVNETYPEAGFTLPWTGQTTMDSNPKSFPTASPEGYTTIPAAANLGATSDFTVAGDGSFSADKFLVDPALTGVPRESADAASATPPATATESIPETKPEELIPDFVSTFVRFDTDRDPKAVLDFYLPEGVDFFEEPTANRASIEAHKARFAELWPSRTFDITGEIVAKAVGENTWTVIYPTHFTLIAADGGWMEGNLVHTLTLKWEGDHFLIASQQEEAKDSKKGNSFGKAINVPKKNPLVTCEFPKPWITDYDEEGLGITASLGEDVVIYVQPIDSTDVTGQTAAARKAIAKEGVKFDEQASGEGMGFINGIDLYGEIWKGKYEGGDTEVRMYTLTMPSTNPAKAVETAILVTVWGAPEDIEKNEKVIERIRHHITLFADKK